MKLTTFEGLAPVCIFDRAAKFAARHLSCYASPVAGHGYEAVAQKRLGIDGDEVCPDAEKLCVDNHRRFDALYDQRGIII